MGKTNASKKSENFQIFFGGLSGPVFLVDHVRMRPQMPSDTGRPFSRRNLLFLGLVLD